MFFYLRKFTLHFRNLRENNCTANFVKLASNGLMSSVIKNVLKLLFETFLKPRPIFFVNNYHNIDTICKTFKIKTI